MEISLKDFTSDKSYSTSLVTSAVDDQLNKLVESKEKKDGSHYLCASPSYTESIVSSNSGSARAGENKRKNTTRESSFSTNDKIKSPDGKNDKVVNLELGSSSRSGADGISTPSSRLRKNFRDESGTDKTQHVHIKNAIGRSDLKNRGREPSLPDSISFTLSESTCYRDRIRDRFNTVKERASELVSRPQSQPRLKMLLIKQTGGRIEDLLRKEEEELNAAITRHKNVKTLWTDASDAAVQAKAQEESLNFFTRIYGDESLEREESFAEGESPTNAENDADGKMFASELLGIKSDSELCQFRIAEIFNTDREKEKTILFFPRSEPVALDEKVESGLAPRFLEQEGIYVGKKIHVSRKMKNKMEQRLLINQDGKKWFGINGEIETGAIPISSVRMRANGRDTNESFVFYEPPALVHRRNQAPDLTRNTHYVLDVDIAMIQFTHHPLFSREHVLAQRLKELLFKYRRRAEINSASRFKGRLEALRRTRDNTIAMAQAAGDDHRHLLRLLQRYEDDIKEVRKIRNREGQSDKELAHKILMTWKDLKQMREIQGYRNTDIKLHIKKTMPKDVEAEKKVWEEEIKKEAKEIYNELKREYEEESAVRRTAREKGEKAQTERIGEESSGSEGSEEEEEEEEEPVPCKAPDLADIRDRVSEYFRKSFKHPGEPQVDFVVGITEDEDYNAQDNREHQRRSAVKRQNVFLKLFYNGKEVCRSKSQSLSPDFKVFISQRFAIRILEWPESLMIEIHEDSGKFAKNLIVSDIFLPLPGCFTTVENSDVQKQEFSGSVFASYNHAGVGSGTDIVPYPNGSDYNNRPTCLLTSGTLAYRIGWAENRGRILSLPEKYWFSTREETAVLGELTASDISTLKEWIKKSNMDPNDPHNSAFFHFLQQAKDSESSDIRYFRLDPLLSQYEFCPEKEIINNKRLKLLKLRDGGELEFRGMRMIPLKENQIQKEVFRAYERRILTPKQSLEISASDQLDGHRIWGRKYLRQMQERILKEYRLARQHKTIHDLVTEESVPDLGTLGLTFMKWLRPKRPLRPVRKERKRITPQNLTGQDVKIIVNAVRAFEVPVRKDVDGLSSSATDPQTFSLVNVRPFVEVSFRGTKARTTAADGANPTWNQDLEIPLYTKNGDLSHASLYSVKDKLYIHLFDEIVVDLIEDDIQRETSIHQRFEKHWLASMEIPFSTLYFNSKIEGTFKLYSPPILLGYEREAHRRQFSGSTGQEPLLPQRDATYISLFITVQPPLNPPDLLKEKLETSETSALEKHLEGWKKEIADMYCHRKVKPLVMDISGKTVCITRFIKALEPPRLLENGETTSEMAARYVAMIPSAAATTIFRGLFDVWLSADNVLRLLAGDSEDHALLLCSYFLHLGMKAFVLLGTGIPHGSAAYVFVTDNSNKSIKYFVWDATTGQKFNINDSFCPLKKIYCLFNNENIWANIQPEEIPRRTRFDLTKRNDWFPAFGKNFAAPAGTVQPERLDYRTTSRQAVDILQDKMEKRLRDSLMKWRKSKRTRWNRYCSGTLRKFLPKLEESIMNAKEGQTPDHLSELQHILASHKMCGFPINMPYTDMEAVVEAVKATGVHSNESEQVEFALSVYIHPYPNDVLSVWIYVASLVRRR